MSDADLRSRDPARARRERIRRGEQVPVEAGDVVEFGTAHPSDMWKTWVCWNQCMFEVPFVATVHATESKNNPGEYLDITCPKCGRLAPVLKERTYRIVEVHR